MTHSIYQCFVFLIAQKEKNSRYLWSCTEWLLADSWICIRGSKGGGAREVTSPVEILSISCSFWEHLAKLCICAPLPLPWGVGAPTSWKSWILHWFVHKYVVVCFSRENHVPSVSDQYYWLLSVRLSGWMGDGPIICTTNPFSSTKYYRSKFRCWAELHTYEVMIPETEHYSCPDNYQSANQSVHQGNVPSGNESHCS